VNAGSIRSTAAPALPPHGAEPNTVYVDPRPVKHPDARPVPTSDPPLGVHPAFHPLSPSSLVGSSPVMDSNYGVAQELPDNWAPEFPPRYYTLAPANPFMPQMPPLLIPPDGGSLPVMPLPASDDVEQVIPNCGKITHTYYHRAQPTAVPRPTSGCNLPAPQAQHSSTDSSHNLDDITSNLDGLLNIHRYRDFNHLEPPKPTGGYLRPPSITHHEENSASQGNSYPSNFHRRYGE
jgi:hypothetical protein